MGSRGWCRGLLTGLMVMGLVGCAAVSPMESARELRPGESREGQLMSGPDRYRFSLAAPARVILESEVFPGQVLEVRPNGRLLNADGEVVARDFASGRQGGNFRIETRLDAGTWYLIVSETHGCRSALRCPDRDARYRVSLRVEPL